MGTWKRNETGKGLTEDNILKFRLRGEFRVEVSVEEVLRNTDGVACGETERMGD